MDKEKLELYYLKSEYRMLARQDWLLLPEEIKRKEMLLRKIFNIEKHRSFCNDKMSHVT
jgi:hypothetical protein